MLPTASLPSAATAAPVSNMAARPLCANCHRPIVQLSSSAKTLCKRCEITEQHKNAKALPASFNAPLPRKDIAKKNLYSFKPSDDLSKEELKDLKRKRPTSLHKQPSYSDNQPAVPRPHHSYQNSSKMIDNQPSRPTDRGLEVSGKGTPLATHAPNDKTSSIGTTPLALQEKLVVVSPQREVIIPLNQNMHKLAALPKQDTHQNPRPDPKVIHASVVPSARQQSLMTDSASPPPKRMKLSYQEKEVRSINRAIEDQILSAERAKKDAEKQAQAREEAQKLAEMEAERAAEEERKRQHEEAERQKIDDKLRVEEEKREKQASQHPLSAPLPKAISPALKSSMGNGTLKSPTPQQSHDLSRSNQEDTGMDMSIPPNRRETALLAKFTSTVADNIASSPISGVLKQPAPATSQLNRPKCPICQNGNQNCCGGFPCERCLKYGRDTKEKCLDPNYRKRSSSKRFSDTASGTSENAEMQDAASADSTSFSSYAASIQPESSVSPASNSISSSTTLREEVVLNNRIPLRLAPFIKSNTPPPIDSPPIDSPPIDSPPIDSPPIDSPPIDSPSPKLSNPTSQPASMAPRNIDHPLSIASPSKQEGSFDSTVLDGFLHKQQSAAVLKQEPTSEELNAGQLWGNIDPRVSWPKQHSEGWLAEKRLEIRARSGRKANFGKLLTPQVVKERKENGWNLHQNRKMVEDFDGAKALEALFGIKDIDKLELGVDAEGKLVMKRRIDVDESDESGRG